MTVKHKSIQEALANGEPHPQKTETSFKSGEEWRGKPRQKSIKTVEEVKAYAREKSRLAIDCLVRLCENPKGDPRAKVEAAKAILERGWGRPVAENSSSNDAAFLQYLKLIQTGGQNGKALVSLLPPIDVTPQEPSKDGPFVDVYEPEGFNPNA